MNLRAILFVAVCSMLLIGCSDEIRTDVSQERKLRHIVGAEYEVIGPVFAYGIRPHSNASVEYVTLMPRPGVQGKMVAFRVPLRIGSKLTVQRVIRTNRLIDPPMSLDVRMEGTVLPTNAPVRVDIFRGNKGEGYLQLNPIFYQLVNSAN